MNEQKPMSRFKRYKFMVWGWCLVIRLAGWPFIQKIFLKVLFITRLTLWYESNKATYFVHMVWFSIFAIGYEAASGIYERCFLYLAYGFFSWQTTKQELSDTEHYVATQTLLALHWNVTRYPFDTKEKGLAALELLDGLRQTAVDEKNKAERKRFHRRVIFIFEGVVLLVYLYWIFCLVLMLRPV